MEINVGFIILGVWLLSGLLRLLPEMVREGRRRKVENAKRQESLEAIRKDGIPQVFLASPQLAILHFGNEVLKVWETVTEPKYRDIEGYPPDWAWRRYAVRLRDHDRCTKCKVTIARPHVHHVKPVRQGGRHGFENLVTLCATCHEREHPGNSWFRKLRFGFVRRWRPTRPPDFRHRR